MKQTYHLSEKAFQLDGKMPFAADLYTLSDLTIFSIMEISGISIFRRSS